MEGKIFSSDGHQIDDQLMTFLSRQGCLWAYVVRLDKDTAKSLHVYLGNPSVEQARPGCSNVRQGKARP